MIKVGAKQSQSINQKRRNLGFRDKMMQKNDLTVYFLCKNVILEEGS